MNRLPWLEIVMIVALAVALITKPQNKQASAAEPQPASLFGSVPAATSVAAR
ncbi:MAG TPA: hypothetical protein VER17_07025 [Tepidisphaeraceae bacterium]|nr:hypothetical protein [Tepidisphaeraceae bacterium]